MERIERSKSELLAFLDKIRAFGRGRPSGRNDSLFPPRCCLVRLDGMKCSDGKGRNRGKAGGGKVEGWMDDDDDCVWMRNFVRGREANFDLHC